MRVSDRQWDAARALTRTPFPSDKASDAPAAAGYLAAVERIEEQGLTFGWKDEDEDRGLVWAAIGSVYLDLAPDGIGRPLHSLRASDARRIAYALLVLADEADAFIPRAGAER